MRIPLFFLVILFLIPTSAYAATEKNEPLNAGFVNTLWYSQENWVVGEKIRIYTAIQNQSPQDIIGILYLYKNDKPVQDTPFSIAKGTIIHQWFDLEITTGTHKIYGVINKTYQSEAGKSPEEISIRFPTSSIAYKTAAIKNSPSTTLLKNNSVATSSSSSVYSTSSILITVSSDQQTSTFTTTSKELSTSSLPAEEKGFGQNSFISQTTHNTKNWIQKLTEGPINGLTEKKQLLDKELQEEKDHQPINLLEESAKKIESKTTFLKIPREKIPSLKQLQSWSLGASIIILNTWWLMLIIFGLLVWNIWKLWRYIRRSENY